jgi:hypothetical protein
VGGGANGAGPPLAAGGALAARLARTPRALGGVLCAGWVLLIWHLSSLSPSDLGGVASAGSFVTNLLHAPEYAALATWLALALRPAGEPPAARPAAGAAAVVLTGLYGAIDELHQAGVPGRDASLFDVLTDVVAARVAVLFLAQLARGEPRARLRRTLLLGALACIASAAAATFLPMLFPQATWL